jgi:hypothetical protein
MDAPIEYHAPAKHKQIVGDAFGGFFLGKLVVFLSRFDDIVKHGYLEPFFLDEDLALRAIQKVHIFQSVGFIELCIMDKEEEDLLVGFQTMPTQLREYDRFEIFIRLAVQFEKHVFFRSEVMVERTDRYPGVLDDLMDGQTGIESILIHQLDGGFENMLLGSLSLQSPRVYLFRLDHYAYSSWNHDSAV